MIVLVPGVGMWPGLFDALRAELDQPAEVFVRPGYDGSSVHHVADLEEQCSALIDFCARWGSTFVVGVSGGATLALAAARRESESIRGLLAHEPLVGPLVPALHRRVEVAGERLAHHPDPASALDFLAGLYHPASWRGLPVEARLWAHRHTATVCAEVGRFASYQPGREDLIAAAPRLTSTVGCRSGPERHAVAAVLSGCGIPVIGIPDAGHLAPVEQPHTFAGVISSISGISPGGTS